MRPLLILLFVGSLSRLSAESVSFTRKGSIGACLLHLSGLGGGSHGKKIVPAPVNIEATIATFKQLMEYRKQHPGNAHLIPEELSRDFINTLTELEDVMRSRWGLSQASRNFKKYAAELRAELQTTKFFNMKKFFAVANEFVIDTNPFRTGNTRWEDLEHAANKMFSEDDMLFFPTTGTLSIQAINDLSPYAIFPVGIIDKTVIVDGRKMPPRRFLIHDLAHWSDVDMGTFKNETSAFMKYFKITPLETKERLYRRFREMADAKSPEERDLHDLIWQVITHEIDAKIMGPHSIHYMLHFAPGNLMDLLRQGIFTTSYPHNEEKAKKICSALQVMIQNEFLNMPSDAPIYIQQSQDLRGK